MKKVISYIMVCIMTLSVSAQNCYAIKLPNPLKIAEDAASTVSDVAESVGDTVTDTAEQAGKAISSVASEAGEVISGAAGTVGSFVFGAVDQAGLLASGFASEAGKVASGWAKQAGKTADDVKKSLSDAGVTIKDTAAELGDATVKTAGGLAELSGKAADDAINAVSGASDFVVDSAGHVVDLAAAGAGYASAAAGKAIHILREKGSMIMGLAEEAVANIDLNDPQNWEKAKTAVEDTIEEAYDAGMLGEGVDEDTVIIITEIVFGTLMYSYQYANGQITLGDYAASMSEVIIKEGLPTGVGFIVAVTPLKKIPHADFIAKEATAYLIAKAYGDKSGDEIEAEEELLMEETIEVLEEETESIMETETESI